MKLSPWIHMTLVGFGAFNIVIGTTLFFYYPEVPFIVISPLIPQFVWASIFLASGVVMLYGLAKHYYKLLRYLMIFGLFMKMMWEMGLLFRILDGGTIFAVELWGMIMYLQLLGVIFFNPEVHDEPL